MPGMARVEWKRMMRWASTILGRIAPGKAVRVCALLACWGIGALNPMSFAAENPVPPFGPGEKLRFEIRWSSIPAGTAELDILPFETIDGVQAYHFVLSATTNEYVDRLYKVRNRIDAYADEGMNQSILYRKKQREGRSKRNVLVEFNWESMEAQYSDAGKKRDPILIPPGTFDILSAFYFMRLSDPDDAVGFQRPVTDGKKSFMGKVRRIKRETIHVPAGAFDTVLYEPDVEHLGGVFEKSPGAKIKLWLTADHRRIPVRIASKVIVGSFVGELVSMKGVSQP
jgi:hypothetical protein